MSKALVTKETCTAQQRALLDALHDENVLKAPARSRFRVAATIAGYSEATPISQITKPILHLILQEAEAILSRAAISAAWALSDIVDGESVEVVKDKMRMDAARDILDRVIPKKEAVKANAPAQVVIMLPAKSSAKVIDVVTDETDDN